MRLRKGKLIPREDGKRIEEFIGAATTGSSLHVGGADAGATGLVRARAEARVRRDGDRAAAAS